MSRPHPARKCGTQAGRILLAALLAGSAPAALVHAREAAGDQSVPQGTPRQEEQAGELEEIVITGTYIRREGYSAPSPLQVIDEEDMAVEGATNITDIVKYIAVNTGSEFNFDRTNQNFTFGTAQFNIRGLGLGATLTLVNGRRVVPSAAVANDGSQFVDVNTLPMNMIQRIEILKDGASALYGSDAVAGVVNIITRHDFTGFEIEGRYQTTTKSGQEDVNINAAFGAGDEDSHVAVFFTFFDRTDLLGIKRAFFPTVLSTETDTGLGFPGTFFPAVPDGMGGYRVAPGPPGLPPGSPGLPPPSQATGTGPVPDPRCLDRSGLDGAASFKLLGPGASTRAGIAVGDDIPILDPGVRGFCSFNFADNFSIVPDERRKLLFAEGRHRLSDAITVYGEFNWADNRATVDASPSLPNLFKPLFVPANNPFIPTPEELGGINPVFHNPDGSPRPVFVQYRVKNNIDGSGQMQVDTTFWRVVGGLRADIGSDWTVDIHYQRSDSDVLFSDNAATVTSFVQAALKGELPGFEGQFLNPFASEAFDKPNPQALEDAVIRTSERRTRSELTTVEGVVSGIIEALRLPGGEVGVAFGAAYRDNNFVLDNDDLLEIGDDFFQPASPDGRGSIDVFGLFGELSLPILANLELQTALRYEDYGEGIGDTLDPKAALRWDVTERVAIRASVGTSFRAPNVTQTDIVEKGTQRMQDPFFPGPGGLTCNVNPDGTISRFRGVNTAFGKLPNPNLKPESATNVNVGTVIEPIDGLRVAADYWFYDYDDVIVLEDNQAIVINDCLDDGIANDPRVTRNASGSIVDVSRQYFNAASVKTDGIDLLVSYTRDLGSLGLVNATASVSWVNKFNIDLGPFGPGHVIKGVGSRNRTNPFRSVPEWRANFPINWMLGRHRVNVTPRIIDGVRDDATGFKVDAETYLDVQYAYRLEELFDALDFAEITAGVVNLFNNHVPAVPNETFRFDSKLHDPRERMVYVRLKFGF